VPAVQAKKAVAATPKAADQKEPESGVTAGQSTPPPGNGKAPQADPKQAAAAQAATAAPPNPDAPGAPDAAPAAQADPKQAAAQAAAADPKQGALVQAPAAASLAGAPPVPPRNPPTDDGDSQTPRFGRRAKILAVAAAAVIVAGALTVTAVATGNKDDASAGVNPTPSLATSLSAAPTSAPTTSPSAEATTASPTGTGSPSASQPAAAPTGHTPSATATSGPASTPRAVSTTPSTGATKSTGAARGSHVSSVAVTSFTCSTGSHKATAKVLVRYDGTTAGTLRLTWWRSGTGSPQGAVTMTPQTAKFPKGAKSYSFMDTFTFTADPKHPYVGLTVSTDPAARSGNGSYGVGCH
jgi:hypothetical protein